jgi:tetratricopeptide (TPR) repeat protein
MRKRIALGLLVATSVIVSVWIGLRIRDFERAAALVQSARRLLDPPLAEAASFVDVRAVEARDLAESAQAISPSSEAAALLNEANVIVRMQRGNYDQAEALLTRSRSAGDQPQLMLLSATLAALRKDDKTAQAWLNRLPPMAAGEPRALMLRSDIARSSGRADEALHYAELGLTQAPRSAALEERRGLADELLGNLAGAHKSFETALALDRHMSSPALSLGRVLRAQGDISGAVLAFREATQRDPEQAEAWLGSGVCRAQLGDHVAARIELEHAAQLSSKRAEPLIALADLDVSEGDLPQAVQRYRTALLIDPDSAAARVKLGNTLLRSSAVADASAVFRSAIEQRPELAAAHNGLGAALLSQGDLEHAEHELKTAAELDPQDAHPLLNLARLYKRRGDTTALANALSQAEARDPRLVIASSDHRSGH